MRYQKWFFGAVLVLGVLAATLFSALASTFTTIDIPGATVIQAFGINNRGQIVGRYIPAGGRFLRGYVLDHGTFTTIDVPGVTFTDTTEAIGINDRGQIVGAYTTGGEFVGHTHGYVLDHGTFTTIDVPGATGGTVAFGINNRGQIVGIYRTTSGLYSFLLDHGTFTTIDVPGAGYASGINDRGQIVEVLPILRTKKQHA